MENFKTYTMRVKDVRKAIGELHNIGADKDKLFRSVKMNQYYLKLWRKRQSQRSIAHSFITKRESI